MRDPIRTDFLLEVEYDTFDLEYMAFWQNRK